jgi:hypothetical protein
MSARNISLHSQSSSFNSGKCWSFSWRNTLIASRHDTNLFKTLPRLSQRTLLYSGKSAYALSISCRRDLNCLWVNEERKTMKLTILTTVSITEFEHSDEISAHKLSGCIMQWKLNTWRPIWSSKSLTNPLFFLTIAGAASVVTQNILFMLMFWFSK